MKGTILNCLSKLVIEKFGKDKWEDALEQAGHTRQAFFLVTQDVEDGEALKIVGAVCKVLDITLEQAADAFGDYWMNEFAPKIYSSYYANANSAKDFLLKMDYVHEVTTQSIPNAKPPRFDYEWRDEKTLIMTYKSHRGLIVFMIGLIKGVGNYFNEQLTVTKLSEEKVSVVFP